MSFNYNKLNCNRTYIRTEHKICMCMHYMYIEGTHCKSAGPYKRPNLNISDISEREIKDECGQHLSGFSVTLLLYK